MIKLVLYLVLIPALGSASAWIGQEWRYEGAVEESDQAKVGAIVFEKLKSDAEAEALWIVSDKEREGQSDGSAIEEAGRAEGRKLGLKGDEIRNRKERVGETTTNKYYLALMFGWQAPMDALKKRLQSNLSPEERENVIVALDVLERSKEKVRDALNYVRVTQATRTADEYDRLAPRGPCRPSPYSSVDLAPARSFQ